MQTLSMHIAQYGDIAALLSKLGPIAQQVQSSLLELLSIRAHGKRGIAAVVNVPEPSGTDLWQDHGFNVAQLRIQRYFLRTALTCPAPGLAKLGTSLIGENRCFWFR